MRQVPHKYIIVGNGRLASHLAKYFTLLDVPFVSWHRQQTTDNLPQLFADSDQILLAIKDDAIVPFIEQWKLPPHKTIHFSGALSTERAIKLHPLMTFTQDLYDLNTYLKIPWVGEKGQAPLSQLLPELSNPYFQLDPADSELYHALCVLSGNGTVVLWQNIFRMFTERLHLPEQILKPYLEQIFKNLITNPSTALTGPWVRGDQLTIQKNTQALQSTALSPIYMSLQRSLQ